MTLISTKSKFNLLTGRTEEHLETYQGFLLHPAVIEDLKKLQIKAKKEINADLSMISAFRSFHKQSIIWDNKLQGKRPVLDDYDNIVNREEFSLENFLLKVLRFSMIPGASRHHWGTDIDIYDNSLLPKEKVKLTPSESLKGGIFYELHQWLDEKLNSEFKNIFYRPYNEDLGGVSIEKWHLSYSPISKNFENEYTIDYFIQNIECSEIEGKNILLKNADFYFKKFVMNITN